MVEVHHPSTRKSHPTPTVAPRKPYDVENQKAAIDVAALATSLKQCVGAPVYGRCRNVFQDLEAFASGFWQTAAHARWNDRLQQNPEWAEAQYQYSTEPDPTKKLERLAHAVKVAFQSTELSQHRDVVAKTLEIEADAWESYREEGLPYGISNKLLSYAGHEEEWGGQWVDTQLRSGLIHQCKAGSDEWNTAELSRIGDVWMDLGYPRIAKTYFDKAAQLALTEKSGRHTGNVAISHWYELKAFETLSPTEKQAQRGRLDQIRSEIAIYSSQPEPPVFDAPIVLHRPEGLRDQDLATYPTVIYPAIMTPQGPSPVGEPQMLNVTTTTVAEMGDRAVAESMEDWDQLMSVVTTQQEGIENHPVPMFDREPIVILRPAETTNDSTYYGTHEQRRNVEEMAWKMAYQLAMVDAADSKTHEAGLGQLHALEAEFSERLHRVKKDVSRDEAYFLTDNFELMVDRRLQRGGMIEAHLLEDELQAAGDIGELIGQAKVLEELAKDHMQPDAQDPIGNALARMMWTLHWNGNLMMDRSQAAVRTVQDKVLIPYGHYQVAQDRLNKLRVDNSWLFSGNGQLDPHVDVSQFPEGQLAATYTGSRYWSSNSDVRNIGVPVGGGIGGGAVGAAVAVKASLLCGPAAPICAGAIVIVGGALGAGGSTWADRELNLLPHAAGIAQSAKTGLSMVKADEWKTRHNQWRFGLYASMVLGVVVGPAGRPIAALAQGAKGGSTAAAAALTDGELVSLDWIGNLARAGREMGVQFVKGMKSPGSMGRMGLSTTGLVADLLTDANYALNPDFTINNMLGWGGGALLMNETVGTYLLGVNANGQFVSLGMNTIGELGMQFMQDRPLTQPDGKRCFWSNTFSLMATGLVRKPVVMGRGHWDSFAFGREVVSPIGRVFPRFANAVRPVVSRDGTVRSWVSPDISLSPAKYRELLKGVEPNDLVKMYPGQFSAKWVLPSKDTEFRMTLSAPLTEKEFALLNIKNTEMAGKWTRVTGADGATQYSLAKGSLSNNDWVALHGLDDTWRWSKGAGDRLGQFRMKTHVDPDTLPVKLVPMVGKGEWQVVTQRNGGGVQYVWRHPKVTHADFKDLEPLLKASKVGSWSPKFTLTGMQTFLPPYLAGILAINAIAGSRMQEADPYYFATHRVLDYGFGAVYTEPFVKVSLGIDTAKAQLAGYSIALGTRVLLNIPFPTYSQTWIGSTKYFERVEGGRVQEAFDVVQRNMTSLTNPAYPVMDPLLGNNGPVSGTWWRLEHRAIQTLRHKHDELFRDAVETKIFGGKTIVDQNAKRLKGFAKMLDNQLQRLGDKDLPVDNARLVLVLATYVKSKLHASAPHANDRILQVTAPFAGLVQRYPTIFASLPELNNADPTWENFVKEVNAGKYDHVIPNGRLAAARSNLHSNPHL